MIWFTVLFAVFLIAMIILADMGKLRFLLWLMNHLPFGDKIVHFFLIGVLSFLVNRTVVRLLPRQNPRSVSIIVTLSLLVIFTFEEISQIPIVGRNASVGDLVANYAGIMIFAWFARQKIKDAAIKPAE